MSCVADWLGAEMEVAVSGGGVLAAVDPWRNVVRGDVTPWPEIRNGDGGHGAAVCLRIRSPVTGLVVARARL